MSCEITYEELAAYSVSDLPAERQSVIEQHLAVCQECRQRLAALQTVDAALRHISPTRPPAGTILATRRLLAEETRPRREPEILTLEEVAEFLRIDIEELRSFATELPAFELGGQIRVRRSRLLEWVEQREREFRRGSIASAIAKITGSGIRSRSRDAPCGAPPPRIRTGGTTASGSCLR